MDIIHMFVQLNMGTSTHLNKDNIRFILMLRNEHVLNDFSMPMTYF